jgi:hypothetical protein
MEPKKDEIKLNKEDALSLYNLELQCKLVKAEIREKEVFLREMQIRFQSELDTHLQGNQLLGIDFANGIIKYSKEKKQK